MKGSYLLVLHLDEDLHQLQVGRLGSFDFRAGYYLYVGSAFGSGGLAARLAHHLRRHKTRPHWHIDYLRPFTHVVEAWTFAGPQRLECVWCRTLSHLPELTIPAPGFGSRDTGCRTHLFYSTHRPHMTLLTTALLTDLPFMPNEGLELQIEIHLFEEP